MNISVMVKRLTDSAVMPKYATDGAAAADLCADLKDAVIILPGQRALIGTGIAISPERSDLVALVFSRSGMGAKSGISLSNSVGVIDSDYRGEIKVSLINHGTEPYTVNHGDRIAQLAFLPIFTASFLSVDDLDATARGEGGFGSTGKN